MAANNWDKLKDLFERQRSEALSAIARLEKEARSFDSSDPEDVADKSVSNFSKEFLFQQLATNRERLRKVDAALERMRTGHFGICVNCGNEIAIKRLEATPWTEYCRDCQEELENSTSPAQEAS